MLCAFADNLGVEAEDTSCAVRRSLTNVTDFSTELPRDTVGLSNAFAAKGSMPKERRKRRELELILVLEGSAEFLDLLPTPLPLLVPLPLKVAPPRLRRRSRLASLEAFVDDGLPSTALGLFNGGSVLKRSDVSDDAPSEDASILFSAVVPRLLSLGPFID